MFTQQHWERAARFLAGNVRQHLFNPQIRPHWLGDGDQFWYQHESPDGPRIMLVDAATGTQSAAPDDFRPAPAPTAGPGETVSPDGTQAAFCRDHNLWLRDRASGAERQLTFDGTAHFAYGASTEMNLTTVSLQRRGIVLPANVAFSPDGRKLFTSRLDERAVQDLPLVQHVPEDGGVRPKLYSMKFALSGDAALPMETHCIIDLATGALTPCPAGPQVTGMTTCLEKDEAWWSADSTQVFFLTRDRYWRRLALYAFATTGTAREIFVETAATFIDTNVSVAGLPNIRILPESGEFIWYSQASGWGHLYLHDLATGARKRAITQGAWLVRDLLHVDPATRTVEFLASGLDPTTNPYHRTLCRAALDHAGLTVLTPGPDDQSLAMPIKRVPRDHIRPAMDTGSWRAPSGRYFVHTRSDLTKLPVSELRRADGSLVCTLATAEVTVPGWRFATPFETLAADGQTRLYGAMWLPSDFDPAKRYPVIDYIYPGPQRGQLPTTALTDVMGELGRSTLPQAFAELGCVVLNIEGRGNPGRSKAFHDECYGKLADPGMLADHVTALQQLAARHPFLNLARVGIMGHSGGGYASVRALLTHPDTFHVAVATSGNHDQRGYSFAWTEKYMGPDADYAAAANPPDAARLQGKLLLATGDMDDNVHPALTLQLAAALIAADKDFDFLPLPNDDHTTVWANPYFLRRAMRFMLDHLS